MSKHNRIGDGLQPLDACELKQVSGGYLSPDQNIQDFPPWLLPYIRPGQLQVKQLAVKNLAAIKSF